MATASIVQQTRSPTAFSRVAELAAGAIGWALGLGATAAAADNAVADEAAETVAVAR